jgi:hypothetical protein
VGEEVSGGRVIGGDGGGGGGGEGSRLEGWGVVGEAVGDGAAGGAWGEGAGVEIGAEAAGGMGCEQPALGVGEEDAADAGEVGAEGAWRQDHRGACGAGGSLPFDHIFATGTEAAQGRGVGCGRGREGVEDSFLRIAHRGFPRRRRGGNGRRGAGCQRASGPPDEGVETVHGILSSGRLPGQWGEATALGDAQPLVLSPLARANPKGWAVRIDRFTCRTCLGENLKLSVRPLFGNIYAHFPNGK